MCGIVGLMANFPVSDARVRLQAALAAMAHRGPDGKGYWANPEGTVALGHRRLSILDLSDAAAQPMLTASGDAALTYNGELYNYAELRAELEQRGIRQHSSGDTETLLHWLEAFGTERLAELHGMFAFGLWSRSGRRLLLARDPLGIKPLYFARLRREGRPLLLFGSELRALLATGWVSRQISVEGLQGYLGWGAVQCPQTILSEVEELPPGHVLSATPEGEVRLTRYWTPAYPPAARPGPPAAGQALREALTGAVRSHRVSDVPIGAFLSGGVDSSVITALLAGAGDTPETLSVTFPDAAAWDESALSDEVARRYGTHHRRVAISAAESLELCRQALEAQDQPSADGVNVYIVSSAARRAGLTVALSGLGGDELFAGYPSFRDVPASARWLRRLGGAGQAVMAAGLELPLRMQPWNRHLQKLHQLTRCARTLTGAYSARRRVFSDRQIAQMTGNRITGSPAAGEVWAEWEAQTRGWDAADAISWLEMSSYMGNTLLRDADVMGMAHSIEIRVPLLHTPLVNWAQAQGPWMRRSWPHPKQALIDATRDLLPEACWNRPKQGFTLPFAAWLQGPMRGEVEEMFLDAPAGWVSAAFLKRLWAAWRQHPAQVGWYRIWSLYVLLRWMRSHAPRAEL